jgi:hypothetical protein
LGQRKRLVFYGCERGRVGSRYARVITPTCRCAAGRAGEGACKRGLSTERAGRGQYFHPALCFLRRHILQLSCERYRIAY